MSVVLPCPRCGLRDSEVADTRPRKHDNANRRRRVCACGHRWTTIETIDRSSIVPGNKKAQAGGGHVWFGGSVGL